MLTIPFLPAAHAQQPQEESPAPTVAQEPAAAADSPAEEAGAADEPAAPEAARDDDGRAEWDFSRYPLQKWWSVFGLIVILLLAIPIARASMHPERKAIASLRPTFFFWLGITYTVVLLGLAILYLTAYVGDHPWLLGGVLPVAVPWFGALGAVTISLAGVFHYGERRWDEHYNYWHLGRPVFGAVLGIVAFFLFVVIVISSGTTPAHLDPTQTVTVKDFIIFYVVAFLVGYREETFRELITRVTDMILTSKTPTGSQAPITFKIAGKTQTTLEAPPGAALTTTHLDVEVHNTGTAALTDAVAMVSSTGQTQAGVFAIVNNLAGPAKFAAGEARTVRVSFTPPTRGEHTGVLVVTATAGVTASIAIKGTGT